MNMCVALLLKQMQSQYFLGPLLLLVVSFNFIEGNLHKTNMLAYWLVTFNGPKFKDFSGEFPSKGADSKFEATGSYSNFKLIIQ